MKPFPFRRRLLARMYLHVAVMFLSAIIGIFVVGRLVFSHSAERYAPITTAVTALIAAQPDGVQLQRAADSFAARNVRMTVYTHDGQLLASTQSPPAHALDQTMLERLARDETLFMPDSRTAVVGNVRDGSLMTYAVIAPDDAAFHVIRREEGALGRLSTLLAIVFAVICVGSIPFVRSIAKPVERLSEAMRAFGLGDLRARAENDRKDEIGDLARQFNQMANRIESLRISEKELLANVSHELRTPLSRIRVVVELASEEGPESALRHLDDIAEDLTEVEQILDDIITTARFDLASEHATEPFSLARVAPTSALALVNAVAAKFRQLHPERCIDCRLPSEDTSIVSDRVLIKHALSNLLDNAHKYSPPDVPIEVTLDAEDGIAIRVRDRGCGIAMEDAPHVFTPFFRADRSRNRETGGVGLGLTLAKRIVDAHGGRLEFENESSGGVTFTMTLPSTRAA